MVASSLSAIHLLPWLCIPLSIFSKRILCCAPGDVCQYLRRKTQTVYHSYLHLPVCIHPRDLFVIKIKHSYLKWCRDTWTCLQGKEVLYSVIMSTNKGNFAVQLSVSVHHWNSGLGKLRPRGCIRPAHHLSSAPHCDHEVKVRCQICGAIILCANGQTLIQAS